MNSKTQSIKDLSKFWFRLAKSFCVFERSLVVFDSLWVIFHCLLRLIKSLKILNSGIYYYVIQALYISN